MDDLSGQEIRGYKLIERIGDGGIIHRLGDVNHEEITIGMTIEAVFKPKNKRQGSILDIQHFRPKVA
jgi:uncharacterized OB-fold protein